MNSNTHSQIHNKNNIPITYTKFKDNNKVEVQLHNTSYNVVW